MLWKRINELIITRSLNMQGSSLLGKFRQADSSLVKQGAPAAKTTSTTLTAAEILGGLLTGNQGGGGAATYTMPLGADIEATLKRDHPELANDDSFDFTIINISVVAAEDITLATNTGLTLVGSLVIEAREATQVQMSSGTFRCRRTAAGTFSVYRVA
jgi:hypothetical protein